MKKLIAVSAVVLMSSAAMASNARITVMGNGLGSFGSNGSYFYNDNYNVFYNPAYVNDYTNWVSLEKAGANSFAGGVTGFGSMNVGLFVNKSDAAPSGVTTGTPLSLIVGGDAGVKWGVGVDYAHDDTADGASFLTLKVGAEISDLDPFVSFRILNKDSADVEHKDFSAGLRYHWGEWTPFAVFSNAGADAATQSTLGVGIGRSAKLKEGLMLNYALAYTRNFDTDASNLPLTIGMEGDVTSWLALRGGFTFSPDDAASTASAVARLGASIKVMGAQLDWAIGGANGGPAADYANVDASNFDIGAGFFTNVGLTYNW